MATVMADDQTIRVKRPDGRYSRIPVASLKDAVAKGYTYAPGVSAPAKADVQSPENPAYQGMTAFMQRASELPKGALDMALSKHWPVIDAKNMGELGKDISSLNPIATENDSFPINAGETAANLLPFAIGGEDSPLAKGAKGARDATATVLDKTLQTPTRIALQRIAGAGKEPVLAEAIKRKSAVSDWVNKSMEAKKAQAEAARVDAQRQSLQRGQQAYADRLRDNLQTTFKTVKGKLDSRWGQLRATPIKRGGTLTALQDEPLNSRAIADSIDVAEKKYLQGSPESLKQFRDLMHWMQDTDDVSRVAREQGGSEPKLRSLSWDEGRTHFSALGDRMYSGDLPGNVFNALRYVRDEGLGGQLKDVATKSGAGPAYESLLNDWSQFERDWKDTSSVTLGGGSPLARALKAPSGETLAPQVLGKTGDLLMERLGKYADAGGSPRTAAALRKMSQAEKDLPSVRVPNAPTKPAAIDPVAIRRAKLLQYAGKPTSAWDYVSPPRLAGRVLDYESIRNWVAKQPRKELQP